MSLWRKDDSKLTDREEHSDEVKWNNKIHKGLSYPFVEGSAAVSATCCWNNQSIDNLVTIGQLFAHSIERSMD